MSINKGMNDEKIPSMNQMYELLQKLSTKIEKIENENIKLRRLIDKRRKVDILEWLNQESEENTVKQTFGKFIMSEVYPEIKDKLEVVFNHDLLEGFKSVWNKVIRDAKSNGETIPIRAFNQKGLVFYIYIHDIENDKNVWVKKNDNEIEFYMKKICDMFVLNFKENWYDKYEKLIETNEEYTKRYYNYYEKILGGKKVTDDNLLNKMRLNLGNMIKENLKEVM